MDTAPAIVHEITLVGSRCGRMEAALPLLEHRIIPVESLIAARYPLARMRPKPSPTRPGGAY